MNWTILMEKELPVWYVIGIYSEDLTFFLFALFSQVSYNVQAYRDI